VTVVLDEGAGTVTIPERVLEQLVVTAAESVDGARVRRALRRRVEIGVDSGRARVELELAIRFGRPIPDTVREVQERVASGLTTMCGLEVEAVDVAVEEIG
jgi:uncharacterized alkaline shock family protein YloU